LQGFSHRFQARSNQSALGARAKTWRVTESGALQSFDTLGKPDAQFPNSYLIRSNRGIIYGTTVEGGAYGYGTTFSLTP
jgi:uncharacterized repeat protein (TIGR03803 family)